MIGTVGEGLFEVGLDPGGDGRLRRGYGGDAANTAVMAARLGCAARVCTRVGADAVGRALVSFWHAAGVDTSWVVVDDDAPTGIYVNESGRFDYHRRGSAGSRLHVDDVGRSFLEGLDVLHTTGVTLAISSSAAEASCDASRRAREGGIATSFAVNHRPALGGDVETLLAEARRSDVVFLSDDEARRLLGVEPVDAARALEGTAREAIVTLGVDGALIWAGGGGEPTRVAAPTVDVVDAAGAGDALAGAYLASRIGGMSAAESLARGVAAASLSCRSFGCALSYPDREAVDALVAG